MARAISFFKHESVLTIAWLLALGSMLLVPPDRTYLDYVDFHTLGLLFSLMAVMAGFQQLGLFRRLGEALLSRTATSRQLEAVLILLPFFSSMIVTNDVALITFVPFALEVLLLARQEDKVIPVVVMQTIAANLGSMTTPIGNPQNLFLYSHYHLSLSAFLSSMLPLSLGALGMLGVFLVVQRSTRLSTQWQDSGSAPTLDKRRILLYLLLFTVCLCGVAKWLPVWLLCLVVLAAVLIWDQRVLAQVDYCLLLTFVGFFLFVGNLGRLPVLSASFARLLEQHELICSVLISQIISNVPAALLLSGFTENAQALLVGVNLGGLGTMIASMASLISYKYLARSHPELKGRYFLGFTLSNLAFLFLLLALYQVTGG